jgi:hypothetical protein
MITKNQNKVSMMRSKSQHKYYEGFGLTAGQWQQMALLSAKLEACGVKTVVLCDVPKKGTGCELVFETSDKKPVVVSIGTTSKCYIEFYRSADKAPESIAQGSMDQWQDIARRIRNWR